MEYEREMMFRNVCENTSFIGMFIMGLYDGMFYTYINKGKAHSLGYRLTRKG